MAKPSLASAMMGTEEPEPISGDDMSEAEDADPKVQAASMVREAIEDGDDESLADALSSFFTLHGAGGGSPAPKPSLTKSLSKE